MTTPETLTTALRPVRDAVLAAGHHDSAEALAAARATAAATMATAREHARQITEAAREQGRNDAVVYLAVQRSRRTMRARADGLRAERAEYERLRTEARKAAAALRIEPTYPELRRQLGHRPRGARTSRGYPGQPGRRPRRHGAGTAARPDADDAG